MTTQVRACPRCKAAQRRCSRECGLGQAAGGQRVAIEPLSGLLRETKGPRAIQRRCATSTVRDAGFTRPDTISRDRETVNWSKRAPLDLCTVFARIRDAARERSTISISSFLCSVLFVSRVRSELPFVRFLPAMGLSVAQRAVDSVSSRALDVAEVVIKRYSLSALRLWQQVTPDRLKLLQLWLISYIVGWIELFQK